VFLAALLCGLDEVEVVTDFFEDHSAPFVVDNLLFLPPLACVDASLERQRLSRRMLQAGRQAAPPLRSLSPKIRSHARAMAAHWQQMEVAQQSSLSIRGSKNPDW